MKKERRSEMPGGVDEGLWEYPEALRQALFRLESQRGPLYLAGGTVRDRLLGRTAADLDCVVRSGAISWCRALRDELGSGALVALGDPEDDTARVVWHGQTIDISGFRGGATEIEDDLRRRDFTINAMAVRLADLGAGAAVSKLIDPLGGRRDLEAGVLRACDRAFIDDPLRMLRGYRLRAVYGFKMDAATRAAIDACARRITMTAVERINHELELILASGRAATTLTDMAASDLFPLIFPELYRGKGLLQPGFHHLDVLDHSLAALCCMEEILRRPEAYFPGFGLVFSAYSAPEDIASGLKWSALLHDLGKPPTMARHPDQDGRATFYNHDRVGREVFTRFAERLKWSRRARELVGELIELHMYPFHLGNVRRTTGLSRRACLKILKRAGGNLPGLFLLAMADSLACRGKKKPAGMEAELAGLFGDLQAIIDRAIQPVLSGPRLVTGTDLIEVFRLPPGPLFAVILDGVELARVEGEIHNRQEALDWIGQYLQNEEIRQMP